MRSHATAEHGKCPDCGCPESHVVRTGTRWGQPWAKLRCVICRRTWTHTEQRKRHTTAPAADAAEPDAETDAETAKPDRDGLAVAYHVLRCPECRSDATRITSTRRPIRYHRCAKCGATFKSIER